MKTSDLRHARDEARREAIRATLSERGRLAAFAALLRGESRRRKREEKARCATRPS